MAGLALGIPIVTNLGRSSEALWKQAGVLMLAASPDASLLSNAVTYILGDRALRDRLALRGKLIYTAKFDMHLTIGMLRGILSTAGEYYEG
jgi:hypothetical protein